MDALTRPVRATHGSDADRRWHQAHAQACRQCWPTPDGLPGMSQCRYQRDIRKAWLIAEIAAQFDDDTATELAE